MWFSSFKNWTFDEEIKARSWSLTWTNPIKAVVYSMILFEKYAVKIFKKVSVWKFLSPKIIL